MKDKNGFLCLRYGEVKQQIKERTGLPAEYITKFMDCYRNAHQQPRAHQFFRNSAKE